MTELIITEKPAAAKKIAEALAEGKVVKRNFKGAPYYEITRNKKKILIGCAVGHLYGLAEKDKNGWVYPVFSVEWTPISEVDKGAAHAKKYLDALIRLCKEADEFVIACDYDIEGETIGYNVLRFACKKKDAKRMKFSTLTKQDLVNSYENALPHIDWGQAYAGETRHEMDWYYGINLSRALTTAIKEAGMFKILSSGRVQGPALKIIADREKEIKAFKPVPYWQIEVRGEIKEGELIASHEKDKFWEKKEASSVVKKVKGKDGKISEVTREEKNLQPPFPFDLTTLQTEAYRCFGINPKYTLEIAQELYTAGYISYPRTSSQQLPPAIGYKGIIEKLSGQEEYTTLCKELLKNQLSPNNGKKTDPAHPAIYPTGIKPGKVSQRGKKIYDLIARRFMATFGEPAVRETLTIKIDISGEIFVAKGTLTKKRGWYEYYGPYVKQKEEELPAAEKGEDFANKKTTMHSKETQPPNRYNQASIIKALEKKNLGTKATRAQIIDTLYNRGYVQGKAIEATDLGIHMVETLENYCPKIVDEELTRHFEMEMEEIQENKKNPEEVLKEAKDVLTKILNEFKEKEDKIGKGLLDANKETQEKANTIGKCVVCGKGTLMVKRGKYGRFIACDKYPECKATFKLPAGGFIKPTEKVCAECNHPMIEVTRKGRKPQEVCINPDCPSKQLKSEKENTACPKCKDGKLVVRKSIYGQFLACSNFPKCRYIEREKKSK
ncbi:DNA topoisomerase I [Candidatus Woesearchaeota archaeon]|nr:DNA topoisomerase I [Candidatus Woesearchaeota archaeon]